MNILVLGSEIPASANMPGSPRLFSLCRRLSADHRLSLLTLHQDPERLQTFQEDPTTASVFAEISVLPKPPQPGWWGRQVHRVRQEPSFVTRSRTPEYFAEQRQRIAQMVSHGGYDVIFADGLPVAQYLVGLGLECPAIIDLHDCFTLLFVRTMEAESRWMRKLALYAESRSIARLERSLSRTFRRIITNSPVDQAFLQKLDPAANTLTIGNGVDSEFFAPSSATPSMTQLVFTGVMDYGPNEDAALFFAEEILPLVRRAHPEVEFYIVGKAPTARVMALDGTGGVHVTGGVPDVRPYLGAAGIFVCPLRFGAGVKNKLLAALSMRKAVVATRLSTEGLQLEEGRDLLLADEPAEFAEKVVQLIDDHARASQLGNQGRATVIGDYSWEVSAKALEAALAGAAGSPATR